MKKYRNSLPGRVGAVAFVAALALSAIAATRSNKAEITRNLDIFNSLYKEDVYKRQAQRTPAGRAYRASRKSARMSQGRL